MFSHTIKELIEQFLSACRCAWRSVYPM